MKQDWSKEEWEVDNLYPNVIRTIEGKTEMAYVNNDPNIFSRTNWVPRAYRIVACVNACQGLSDEDLKMVKRIKDLRCQLEYLVNICCTARLLKEIWEPAQNILTLIKKGE